MERPVDFGRMLRFAALGAAVVASASCAGDLAREGRSPAFLVITELTASAGGPSVRSGFRQLESDVQIIVNQTINGVQTPVPTVFADSGTALLVLGLKNPGSTTSPTSPSSLNFITVTRYRVEFQRADGRNTPGVDVPYGFDGGTTATVDSLTATTRVDFDFVRHSQKLEPPLRNLVGGGGAGIIHTIATITFYGHDQAGNEVAVSGQMTVNFGDFADPS